MEGEVYQANREHRRRRRREDRTQGFLRNTRVWARGGVRDRTNPFAWSRHVGGGLTAWTPPLAEIYTISGCER